MEQKKFERKHFFINRSMQVRYMLTFLIPMLIMLVFWMCTLTFAINSLLTSTTKLIRSEVDHRITVQLQDQATPSVEIYQGVVSDITDYLRTFAGDKKVRKIFTDSLLWVFGVGLLIVIVQITVLTIFFSHKIAGPVYRFEKACQSVLEGNYTDRVRLRQGDEMVNLAGLFNGMLEKTQVRLKECSSSNPDEKEKCLSSLKL